MSYEKDYVISYRRTCGGYPCTALVNAHNWKEAEEKVREHIRDNYRRHVKPEFLKWDAIEDEVSHLIFHRGVALATILDIRD